MPRRGRESRRDVGGGMHMAAASRIAYGVPCYSLPAPIPTKEVAFGGERE